MTSLLAKSKQIIVRLSDAFFLQFSYFLMFLNIHTYLIILKTYDPQFTLTTKKSLHIIFKPRLHDTASCQTGCTTGLTTGCIV